MSQRHRSHDAGTSPKVELRAKAHSERHRIHVELQAVANQVSSGVDPDEVHEPGPAWIPEARREPAAAEDPRRSRRHWKLKMWKRRTNQRLARAQLTELAAREA